MGIEGPNQAMQPTAGRSDDFNVLLRDDARFRQR
jgi:hypothetical protein